MKTDPLIFAEEMNEVDRCLDMLNIMRMRYVAEFHIFLLVSYFFIDGLWLEDSGF